MDETQPPARASGIPRLSRLPVPRSVGAASAASSSLRPAASRESLSGDLRSSRLRSVASRDTLDARRSDTWDTAAQKGRITRAKEVAEEECAKRASDPAPASTGTKDSDDFLFKRRLTLTRRPSDLFSKDPSRPVPAGTPSDTGDESGPPTNSTDASFTFDTPKASGPAKRGLKPRPSLSERTIETLSRIPSSPALSKKPSSFFDQDSSRPTSRGGPGSRPGTGYSNDRTRSKSRPGSSHTSRPSSSSGNEEAPAAESRLGRSRLGRIEGTPAKTPQPASKTLKTPVRTAPSRMAQSASKMPSPAVRTPVTPAPRQLKPRTSTNGLLKKPSRSVLAKPAEEPAPTSASGSWDGTIVPPAAPPSEPQAKPEPTSRKSSAALREQIAKMKAAKRAAARQGLRRSGGTPPRDDEPEAAPEPVEEAREPTPEPEPAPEHQPSPEPVAFAPVEAEPFHHNDPFAHRDPFNQRQNAKSKVLQQRLATARTSGRLNIAALGYKKMPEEVLKMYDMETIGTYDGSWAENVDLTRFVAADNELEVIDDVFFPDVSPDAMDDDTGGNVFGGLETLDLHGNLLVSVPRGLRQLRLLTSLNLSQNRLQNGCIEAISQITSLRDLKLTNNLFYGPLDASIASLEGLEILDLHGNNISALPAGIANLSRLRILNISENSFETLAFEHLAKLPLTELLARRNKLSGTLIPDSVDSLPVMQSLDLSMNNITRLVAPGATIALPSLHQLTLSMNSIQELPDVSSWTSLLTLAVDENSITTVPEGFTSLEKLRHADFSSNDIRVVPPEIARMDSLAMFRITGNPLRGTDKKFTSITTDELKDILANRLEPPPPYQAQVADSLLAQKAQDLGIVPGDGSSMLEPKAVAKAETETCTVDTARSNGPDEDRSSDMDDFATPPTSAPASPARSRSQTLGGHHSCWPVKSGGVLDRSRTESSSLHPVICSRVAAEHTIREVQLHHNSFSTLPECLSFFAATLTSLSMSHNQLVSGTYLTEPLELPALKELNLSSNHITTLGPLTTYLIAPSLLKLDVSTNRITALPPSLREIFPSLDVILLNDNHIAELDPEAVRGLSVVDASNNDIAHLNPKLGLLGRQGLKRLEVRGNRFRVPRWSVLERGTEATLRWLRGRVPVSERGSVSGSGSEEN